MSASSTTAIGSTANPQSNTEVRMSSDVSSTGSPNPQSSTEVHMSGEDSSTSSSTQSNNQEVSMTTDGSTTSSIPSSTQDGGSNGSTSTETEGSTPEKPKPAKKPRKKPVDPAAPYMSDTETDLAETATAKNLTNPDPGVQAAVAQTNAFRQDVHAKRNEVQACSTQASEARAEREGALAKLKVGLLGAMWTIRGQSDGRKFAKGLEAKTEVQTAENVLSMVPGSAFTVPADTMTLIANAVGPVRAAELKLAAAGDRMKVVGPAYTRSVAALRASTLRLNATARAAKYQALIPVAPSAVPPLKHPAPVDQPVKSSVRVTRSSAAHANKKQD